MNILTIPDPDRRHRSGDVAHGACLLLAGAGAVASLVSGNFVAAAFALTTLYWCAIAWSARRRRRPVRMHVRVDRQTLDMLLAERAREHRQRVKGHLPGDGHGMQS